MWRLHSLSLTFSMSIFASHQPFFMQNSGSRHIIVQDPFALVDKCLRLPFFQFRNLSTTVLIASSTLQEDDAFEDVHCVRPPSKTSSPAADSQVFEDAHQEDADMVEDEGNLDLRSGFCLPGLHHILDNCTAGLEAVIAHHSEHVTQAKAVCKLLRSRKWRPKLKERLFSSELRQHLFEEVESFTGKIYKGRWGTLAYGVAALLRIKTVILYVWDKNAMSGVFLRCPASDGSLPRVCVCVCRQFTASPFEVKGHAGRLQSEVRVIRCFIPCAPQVLTSCCHTPKRWCE